MSSYDHLNEILFILKTILIQINEVLQTNLDADIYNNLKILVIVAFYTAFFKIAKDLFYHGFYSIIYFFINASREVDRINQIQQFITQEKPLNISSKNHKLKWPF